MASENNQYLRLRPLVADDIDVCARISGSSFEHDRNTLFKASSRVNPYDHEGGMKNALQFWLDELSSTKEMTVAVNHSNGDILGWIVWGFRGFEPEPKDDDQQQKPPLQNKLAQSTSRQQTLSESPKPQQATPEENMPQSSRQSLESYTDADLRAWMQRLMPPGTRCMYIRSIAVNKLNQCEGVGSALIQQGLQRADAEDVFCWVHSSDASSTFYASHGFSEVGKLTIDLDAFNVEDLVPPEGKDALWGTYEFTYMRREPRTRTK